jgi:hypothetical protein
LASQIQQIQAQQMLKDQMAANNLLFPSNAAASSNLGPALPNIDANANQLALLQSFTCEMAIPQGSLYQQQQQQPTTNIKSEINNNGSGSDEHMASGSQ